MTADDATIEVLGDPVLFLVDADPQARVVTESALARRFGPDYRVLAADTPRGGLEVLDRLAAQGSDVALIAADLRLPDIDGVEFLKRAHALHPRAARVLLVAMDQHHTQLPLSQLAALRRATALGRIDFWVAKGWANPEEWLYPQVQEALTAWTIACRPGHLVYRIVGEQWAPRSHDLRDALACNGVPFAFYAADSGVGRQLIEQFRIDVRRLPALVRHDGTVLQDPSFAEVAAAHGIQTRPWGSRGRICHRRLSPSIPHRARKVRQPFQPSGSNPGHLGHHHQGHSRRAWLSGVRPDARACGIGTTGALSCVGYAEMVALGRADRGYRPGPGAWPAAVSTIRELEQAWRWVQYGIPLPLAARFR